jgi:hypothetical protein
MSNPQSNHRKGTEYVAAWERLDSARLAYVAAWRNLLEHEPSHTFDLELVEIVDLQKAFMRPEYEEGGENV